MMTTVLTASNNLAAWRDYRTFRRNLLAIAELEQRLAADMYEAEERARGGNVMALDREFLRQSVRALADTAADARASVERIAAAIPPDRQRDSTALIAAAAVHLPDLDAASRSALIAHFDRNGGPVGLLNEIATHLRAREGRYSAGARLLRKLDADPSSSFANVRAQIFEKRRAAPSAAAGEDLTRQIAASTDRAEKAIRAGAAYPVALAERTALAGRLFQRDPIGAVKLGFSAGPLGDPEPLLCLIFGLGWAICVVILVAAVASHDVEGEDEDG